MSCAPSAYRHNSHRVAGDEDRSTPASERLADFKSEWVADLIGRRTSAVERVMEMQEVIMGAIDGWVRWCQGGESLRTSDGCGAFIRAIPQINPKRALGVNHVFSTGQSG